MRISDWSSDVCSSDLDRGGAGGAGAQLQGTVGVLVVERLALHAVWIVHLHVAMLEEHDVARLLAGDALAHGAVAGVVVERLVVRASMDMVAPSRSAERRVGKECVSTCKSRWARVH